MKRDPWCSVIIVARNEERCLGAAVERARAPGVEVLVVDGGSSDATAEVARSRGAEVLHCSPNRARQLNRGAAAARGDVLVFLHADTLLPVGFADAVKQCLARPDVVAGAFRLCLDERRRSLRFISAMANLRSRALQLPFGDQALFLRRDVFESLEGFSDLPILEDYEFVRRLRRCGKVQLCPEVVQSSARRWIEHGVVKTTLHHQLLLWAYHLRVSPEHLARWRNGG